MTAVYTNKTKQSTSYTPKLGVHDGWQYNEPNITYNEAGGLYNHFKGLTAYINKLVSVQGVAQRDLLIGSGFKLNIGSGFNLVIEPDTTVGTIYTNKPINN